MNSTSAVAYLYRHSLRSWIKPGVVVLIVVACIDAVNTLYVLYSLVQTPNISIWVHRAILICAHLTRGAAYFIMADAAGILIPFRRGKEPAWYATPMHSGTPVVAVSLAVLVGMALPLAGIDAVVSLAMNRIMNPEASIGAYGYWIPLETLAQGLQFVLCSVCVHLALSGVVNRWIVSGTLGAGAVVSTYATQALLSLRSNIHGIGWPLDDLPSYSLLRAILFVLGGFVLVLVLQRLLVGISARRMPGPMQIVMLCTFLGLPLMIAGAVVLDRLVGWCAVVPGEVLSGCFGVVQVLLGAMFPQVPIVVMSVFGEADTQVTLYEFHGILMRPYAAMITGLAYFVLVLWLWLSAAIRCLDARRLPRGGSS